MIIPIALRRPSSEIRRRPVARRRAFLEVERCESRTLMATLLGVDPTNNLIRFTSTAPGTQVSSTPITGLSNAAGETIAGFDYRPIDTTLYAITSDSESVGRLYTIDIATGAASLEATLTADPTDVTAPYTGLSGTRFGVDFNPVADRLRVVSNTGQNLRINVGTGRVITDGILNPGTPNVTGAAYTNNLPGAASTQLYDIDTTTDTLFLQTPPNNGTLVSVGALGVNASDIVGFDIQTVGMTNTAYASLVVGGVTGLYVLDLTTGAATLVGATSANIRALAITPDAYTAALAGDTATFTGTAAGAMITIDQAGGLVRHNRYSQGDSGFNSDFDFDSTVAGDQTLSVASLTATVIINALGGNDTATVEFANGNPAPGGGIDFDGGTGLNTLILQRSSGNFSAVNETHTATGPGAGTIVIDARTITFSNLAPVIDTVPATNFTFTSPSGSQTIDIVDGPVVGVDQTTRIVSGDTPAAFEQVDFANKQFVTVNGSSSADLITLNNPAPAAGLVELDINALNGNDTVSVAGNTLSAAVAYMLDGGGGIDTLSLDAGFTTATLGAGTILLSSGAQVDFTNFENVNVANLASPTPIVQPPDPTILAVEGTEFVNRTVAVFATTRLGADASDFGATIDWGDGTSSAGTITQDASIPSLFYVTGSHLYLDGGTIPITTTIVDTGGTATVVDGGTTTTITYGFSETVDASASALVSDLEIGGLINLLAATVGTPLSNVIVANFSDAGTPRPVSEYSAVIDWGDGTPLSAGTIVAQGGGFQVTGDHIFAVAGNFTGRVTIQASEGATISVPFSTAAVAPTLSVIPLAATEGQTLTNVAIASLSTLPGNPSLAPNFYTAIVDFGDGSNSVLGFVDSSGVVRASHLYEESGTFTTRVTIGVTGNPNVVTASLAQVVADIPIVITGALARTSDTGQSDSDGITNDATPTFQGTSEPGSLISVFALPVVNGVAGSPVKIADAVTNEAGAWQATTLQPLADGSYQIRVTAIDENGLTTATITLAQTVLIDTVGPRVTNTGFDRLGGRVGSSLQDDRSGLDQSTLIDGSNYRFSGRSLVRGYHGPARFLVTSLDVSAATSATSPQTVIASINQGRVIRGGRYQFTIFSGLAGDNRGIRDIAGNALDGEYYGFFPSGNLKVGGDFVAGLNAIHNRIFVPRPIQDGFATPLNPPGTRDQIRNVNNPGIQALSTLKARAKATHPTGPRFRGRHV